jgi:hypothetical protein
MAAEALRLILPYAERNPETYGGLARTITAALLRHNDAAGQAPHHALLEHAAQVLAPPDQEQAEIEAVKTIVRAILEAAEETGELDEKALATLPPMLADQLRFSPGRKVRIGSFSTKREGAGTFRSTPVSGNAAFREKGRGASPPCLRP